MPTLVICLISRMLQMESGHFAVNAPNEKIYDNDDSPTYLQLYEAVLGGWRFSGNSTYSGSMILEKDGKCMLVFASTRANRFGFKGDFIQNAALTYLNKSDLFANHLAEALLVTKACVKKYGKSNVCVVGAYSGGMLAQYVSAMTGVEGTAFNSGTAGYKLRSLITPMILIALAVSISWLARLTLATRPTNLPQKASRPCRKNCMTMQGSLALRLLRTKG